MSASKLRASIVTAIAALSVLAAAGPMTSAASARPVVKVGPISVECSGKTREGMTAWFAEGTVVTIENPATGEKHSYECKYGKWFKISQEVLGTSPVVEEPMVSTPKTSQERLSTAPTLAG